MGADVVEYAGSGRVREGGSSPSTGRYNSTHPDRTGDWREGMGDHPASSALAVQAWKLCYLLRRRVLGVRGLEVEFEGGIWRLIVVAGKEVSSGWPGAGGQRILPVLLSDSLILNLETWLMCLPGTSASGEPDVLPDASPGSVTSSAVNLRALLSLRLSSRSSVLRPQEDALLPPCGKEEPGQSLGPLGLWETQATRSLKPFPEEPSRRKLILHCLGEGHLPVPCMLHGP